MTNLKICILLILALTLGACTSTKSTNMLGNYALKLNEDEWNGTWVIENEAYQIKVINPDFGIMQSISIEDGKIKKHRIFATQSGDDKYINLVAPDKRFFFAKFKKEQNSVIVWLPSKEMLKKAIENSEIEGKVDKDDNVLITASGKAFSEFMKTNKNMMMFEYENPGIFKRLVK